MNRFIGTFIVLFIVVSSIFAQETNPKSTVFLKNGDKFVGQILMRTDEVIVVQTDDGRRFQFQFSEIDKIQQQEKITDEKPITERSNFSGIVELDGGLAQASVERIRLSPRISGTVAFGSRDFLKSKVFAGLGTGMEVIFSKNMDENLLLLPFFIRLNKTFTDKSIKPFVGADAGYAFCLNKEYKGGVLFKLTGGANFSVSRKLSFNMGFFGKIQQISGTVIEKNEYGSFLKEGSAQIISGGVSLGFWF